LEYSVGAADLVAVASFVVVSIPFDLSEDPVFGRPLLVSVWSIWVVAEDHYSFVDPKMS
jgi:hypothetical protein